MSPITDVPLTPEQELLQFLFERASGQQLYRDTQNNVYQRGIQPNGMGYFYFRECSLEEFVAHSVMPRHSYSKEYDTLTSHADIPRRMFDLLSCLPDSRFPFIR